MAKSDTNKDGKLDLQEWKRAGGTEEDFKEIDFDGDGMVDQVEKEVGEMAFVSRLEQQVQLQYSHKIEQASSMEEVVRLCAEMYLWMRNEGQALLMEEQDRSSQAQARLKEAKQREMIQYERIYQLESKLAFLTKFDPRNEESPCSCREDVTAEQVSGAYALIKRFVRRWVLRRRLLAAQRSTDGFDKLKKAVTSAENFIKHISNVNVQYTEYMLQLDTHYMESLLPMFAQWAGTEVDPHGWKNEMFVELHEATHDLYIAQKKMKDDMMAGLQGCANNNQVVIEGLHHYFLSREIISRFMNRYPPILEHIRLLKRIHPSCAETLERLEKTSERRRTLDMLCFQTLQRIAMMPENVKELVKKLAPTDYYAKKLARCQEVTVETGRWLDERNSWYNRLITMQASIVSDFNYVFEGRRLLKDGPLSMVHAGRSGKPLLSKCQLFLLTDCLLVCEAHTHMTPEVKILRHCFLEQAGCEPEEMTTLPEEAAEHADEACVSADELALVLRKFYARKQKSRSLEVTGQGLG